MSTKVCKNLLAFTLAEILIVIGIIGIIAELTLPPLVTNIQEQVLKTSFKKAYSVASQSWSQVVAENPETYIAKGGSDCTWPDGITADYNSPDGRTDAFKSKQKVIKTCQNESGCWSQNWESYLDLFGMSSYLPSRYSWVTADGMCWSNPWVGLDETHILVDTNCNKKPNKIGQDMFSMLLGKDGVVYFYIDDTSTYGKPVSSGYVSPQLDDPAVINGRSVSFKNWLQN